MQRAAWRRLRRAGWKGFEALLIQLGGRVVIRAVEIVAQQLVWPSGCSRTKRITRRMGTPTSASAWLASISELDGLGYDLAGSGELQLVEIGVVHGAHDHRHTGVLDVGWAS